MLKELVKAFNISLIKISSTLPECMEADIYPYAGVVMFIAKILLYFICGTLQNIKEFIAYKVIGTHEWPVTQLVNNECTDILFCWNFNWNVSFHAKLGV